MVLDLEQAEVLAKVLTKFDALVRPEELDFRFDSELWMHTVIELLSSAKLAGPLPFPVYVAQGVDGDRWFA